MNNIEIVEYLINSAFESQMQNNFNRIKEGKRLDIQNIPYNMEYLKNMINFYSEREEYEKCEITLSFMNMILDHDKNYIK